MGPKRLEVGHKELIQPCFPIFFLNLEKLMWDSIFQHLIFSTVYTYIMFSLTSSTPCALDIFLFET